MINGLKLTTLYYKTQVYAKELHPYLFNLKIISSHCINGHRQRNGFFDILINDILYLDRLKTQQQK
jgi:hypothetical protein